MRNRRSSKNWKAMKEPCRCLEEERSSRGDKCKGPEVSLVCCRNKEANMAGADWVRERMVENIERYPEADQRRPGLYDCMCEFLWGR